MGFAKHMQDINIIQNRPVIISTDAELLAIEKNKIMISNKKTKAVSIWQDTNGDGKFDVKETIDMTGRKKMTKLDESKSDAKTVKDQLLEKFRKTQSDESKAKIQQKENKKVQIDGKMGASVQGNSGDCWLLAGVNALAKNKTGAKMIKELISVDQKGNATVKLKGTGEVYTFSPNEIKSARVRLSSGDDDVRIIEMAMEKHRAKLIKQGASKSILEELGLKDVKSSIGSGTKENPLKSGYSSELFEVLLGKKTERCKNSNFLQIAENKVAGAFGGKDPNYYLTQMQKNPQKYAATMSFRNGVGSLIVSGHEYSIASVDKETVSLVNPWDSSKILKMKRADFLKNCGDLDVCDLTQNK